MTRASPRSPSPDRRTLSGPPPHTPASLLLPELPEHPTAQAPTRRAPRTLVASLANFVRSVSIPLSDLAAARGSTLTAHRAFRRRARYTDMALRVVLLRRACSPRTPIVLSRSLHTRTSSAHAGTRYHSHHSACTKSPSMQCTAATTHKPTCIWHLLALSTYKLWHANRFRVAHLHEDQDALARRILRLPRHRDGLVRTVCVLLYLTGVLCSPACALASTLSSSPHCHSSTHAFVRSVRDRSQPMSPPTAVPCATTRRWHLAYPSPRCDGLDISRLHRHSLFYTSRLR
ncbi:hypothetical protein BV20DRAFT_50558 [Pilatotrama ljubarskyi]|nr:hypothetical protein BV20DRAFT_50558 [Pilatotrama ljubarskyi]